MALGPNNVEARRDSFIKNSASCSALSRVPITEEIIKNNHKRFIWTSELDALIPIALRKLHEAGVPLRPKFFYGNDKSYHSDIQKILDIVFAPYKISPKQLHYRLYEISPRGFLHYVQSLGLPIGDKHPYTSYRCNIRRSIILALRKLHADGFDLSTRSLRAITLEKSPDKCVCIARALNLPDANATVTGSAFYELCGRYYGCYKNALREAGVVLSHVLKRVRWSEEQVRRIPELLRALYDEGFIMNSINFTEPNDIQKRLARRVISEVLGPEYVCDPKYVYQRIIRRKDLFKSFSDALIQAGLERATAFEKKIVKRRQKTS